MTIELKNARETNMGANHRHWDVMVGGKHVANLGHPVRPFAPWNVLPMDGTLEYRSFATKGAALAYAGTL